MYTVQAHETPAHIAQKFTGNPRRFRELIAVNPHKPRRGQTFQSLREGERLHIPRTWPAQVIGTGRGGGGGGHGGGGHGGGLARGAIRHGGGGGGLARGAIPHGGGGLARGASAHAAAASPAHAVSSPAHHPASHPGHHPGHGGGGHGGGHFGHSFGRRRGWGGWGWGAGWWTGDWYIVCYGCTPSDAENCSWSPYSGTNPDVLKKQQVLKLQDGQVIFYRFASAPGLFQFFAGQNGATQVAFCNDGIVGVGQDYLWNRFPGEIEPDRPAHTQVIGLAGCACKPSKPCPAHDPNYGSSEPHLRAGQGPLSSGERWDPCQDMLGQLPHVPPPAYQEPFHLPNNIPTQAYNQPIITTPVAPIVSPPASPPPVAPVAPVVVAPPAPAPAPVPVSTTPSVIAPPAAAPVVTAPASPSPGMLIAGFAAVGLGVAGIIYLVNVRKQPTGS
jgi:hypothetical protein